MAIVSVNEHHAGRRGRETSDGTYEYVRNFIVVTDDVATTTATIRGHASIPDIGDAHPENAKATAHTIDPTPIGDQRKVWMVEVLYSSKARGVTDTGGTYPWNRDAKIRWGSYATVEIVEEDKDSNPIENSAGDRFDPPLEIELHHPTVLITRYEQTFDVNDALDYIDHVNLSSTTIAGLSIGAEQALVTRYEAEEVEVDGYECWLVTYEIYFSPSYKKRVLDQGLYYIDASGKHIRAKDDDGENRVEPILLDGSGGALTPSGTPVYKEFRIYPRVDFTGMGLP